MRTHSSGQLFVMLGVIVATGCDDGRRTTGSGPTRRNSSCTPGLSAQCVCPDMAIGQKVCDSAGSFGVCACPAGGDGGQPSDGASSPDDASTPGDGGSIAFDAGVAADANAVADARVPSDAGFPQDTLAADARAPHDAGHRDADPPDMGFAADAMPADTGHPCTPFVPTSCPSGQVCQTNGCYAEGPNTVNQACGPQNLCQRGLICLHLGGGSRCHEACDHAGSWSCAEANRTCSAELRTTSGGWGFGLCQGPPCSPFDLSACTATETCVPAGAAFACSPAGTGQIGDPCGVVGCVRGALCVDLTGNGPVCLEPCTPQNPCSTGSCALFPNAGWGVCQ